MRSVYRLVIDSLACHPQRPLSSRAVSAARIPAYCPSCGALFPSVIGSIFPSSNLHLEGNVHTCPRCGGLARIADGAFTLAGDVITAVSASRITMEMLAALGHAAKRAYREQQPPETLAKEVEKIDPGIAEVIRESGRSGFYRAALLMIILYAIHSCSLKVTLDINRLIDQMQSMPTEVILAPEPPEMEPRPDQPPP